MLHLTFGSTDMEYKITFIVNVGICGYTDDLCANLLFNKNPKSTLKLKK